MVRYRIPFLLALGATFTWAASPAAAPPPAPADASATVTVTAEASPVEIVKTPNPVRILDKLAIEASGATTLGDLLTSVFPGQILANGGVGTASSQHLGGSRNQDVVVTLDGIRLEDASGVGGVNLNTLGLAGIERVEVEMGPSSTRFGSEAMGGVVALYSAGTAAKGLSGELGLGLGSQGIRNASFAPAYGWVGGWVRAALQASQEEQATATDLPFRTTGTYVGLGQELGQDTVATFTYRNAFTGVPTPWSSTPPTVAAYKPAREELNRTQQLMGSIRSALTPDLLLEATLGQVLQTRYEPDYIGSGRTPYDSRRNQLLGSLAWTPSAALRVNAALDAYQEVATTPDWMGGDDRGEGRHRGVNLEVSSEPVTWLRLVGSARHQWDSQSFSYPGQAPADTDTSASTWKLGANVVLGRGWRVYASAGSAFSLPLLYQVMYNSNSNNVYTPLPALQKEASTFQRLGASWEQGPWNARLEASRTTFSHLVVFDLGAFAYLNESNIHIQGVEGAVGYKAAHGGFEAFWHNQEARDLDARSGQQLASAGVIRVPFNTLGAKAWKALGAWRFEGRWGWTGGRYETYGTYPAVVTADKTHFNDVSAAATWAASPKLALTLRGDHLLQPRLSVQDWERRTTDGQNDAYQIYGFPAQPPTVSLQLRYRF